MEQDPRWRAFNDNSTACACCAETFNGIFDRGYDHPDHWIHANRTESGKDSLSFGDDWLNANLCAVGEQRFVRGVLDLPVKGSDIPFGFGVWCSLKPENYDAYAAIIHTDNNTSLGSFFGWMSNSLPYYDTEAPLACDVVFQDGGVRPLIKVHDDTHPLGHDQVNGITFDTLLDIYAAAGRDIRPHLER
ncbi:MAG: DUF2199 domain-containing protein [Ascidiaceihabitans sp.]|nr:DUF2199 domain-containing protein [Ascidiaceihabitans sp.]